MTQGANAQAVWGFEEVAGVAKPGQKAATMYGIRFHNFNSLADPATERTTNIDPAGELLLARNGYYNLPWSTEADMSVDDIARLRFHMQGMATISTVAAGVQSWALRHRLTTDAPTVASDWLSIEVDKDDGYAELLLNAAVTDWTISVKGGKIVTHKLAGMACRFTHMKDPVFTTNTGTFTGTMNVRGNRQDADAQDLTNDIKVKVTTPGALGVFKVEFTKGATAYGAPEIGPIVDGVWYEVIYADGTHASGDPLNPVQVMWSGAGAPALNDLWTIVAKRPKVTPTYPSRNPLIGLKAIVTVGGIPYDVETFDINFKRPLKYRRGTSSPFPIGLLYDGTRTFDISITKDYIERDFYLAMLSASPKTLDITINGDLIATVASVSYYEKHQFIAGAVQLLKGGANVPNDKQLPEVVQIVPARVGGVTELSEVVQGTLATLK
jgi:hypothetical protein